MTTVRLPRHLHAAFVSGALTLTERERVHPAKLPITIETHGVSTAKMALGEDEPDIAMHDWFELYTDNGSVGLFRATNTAWTLRRSRIVTLRHARDTFADSVWVNGKSDKYDYSGTVADYLSQIISHQKEPYWQMGVCECTDTTERQWKRSGIYYTRLSELLDELEEKRKNYMFEYDFSTTPWTLNFVRMPDEEGVEFRLRRNVSGCKISYDDEDMCNKLYMTWSVDKTKQSGWGSGHLIDTGSPVIDRTIKIYENAESQNQYGLIEKTADVKDSNEPSADAWASVYLAEHADPSVEISIDGANLYALTGVVWDETNRGKKARVALPDYGITLTERLMTVEYTDVINEPDRITASLANRRESIASSLASAQKSGGGGVSTAATAEEEAAAEGRRARAAESALGSRVSANESAIEADHLDIVEIQGDIVSINSNITSINSQVVSINSDITTIRSNITSIEGDLLDVDTRITSLQQTFATAITTASLTVLGSAAITSGLTAATLADSGGQYKSRNISCGSVPGGSVLSYTSADLDLDHSHSITLSVSGGTVTATIGGAQGGSGSDSFSIADTTYYRDAVSAAETRGANSVQINRITLTPTTGYVTATAYLTNGASDSDSISFDVTTGYWNNGSIDVRFAAGGTLVSSRSVSMPSSADSFSVTVDGPSGAHGTYSASCTVGGKRYSTSGNWSS